MRAGKTEKHNRQIPTLKLKINVCVVVHKNRAMDVDHDSNESSQHQYCILIKPVSLESVGETQSNVKESILLAYFSPA